MPVMTARMRGTSQVARSWAVGIAFAGALVWPSHVVDGQAAHHCAGAATEQARKLLTFHFGPDDRIEIASSVKMLAPMRNPVNRARRFDVLEVWGFVYKGQYRMRFLYAQLPGECVLMGQEVLEFGSP